MADTNCARTGVVLVQAKEGRGGAEGGPGKKEARMYSTWKAHDKKDDGNCPEQQRT